MNEQPKKRSRTNLKIVLILAAIAIVICVGLRLAALPSLRILGGTGATYPTHTASSSSTKEDAWYACTTAIDKKYGVSFMDAQRYDASAVSGADPYEIAVYYPKTNATFFCTVSKMADGNWYIVASH
jgi:hypothetical protein